MVIRSNPEQLATPKVIEKLHTNLAEILNDKKSKKDVRLTTYIEAELHDVITRLKGEGVTLKKLFNEALREFLVKHNEI